MIAERCRDPLVCRAEDGSHRHTHSRRQVHRSRIITDEGGTPCQDAGKLPKIGSSNQIDEYRAGRHQ